jgi:hypothetical protein
MMAVLAVDLFWSIWLTVVVVTELVLIALNVTNMLPSWLFAAPVYFGAAGAASAVYSVAYEFIAHPPARKWKADAQKRDVPEPVSTGESIIPGAFGTALLTFAVFLNVALYKAQPLIAIVGLPLVFVTAPLFAMFAFGYARGQPDVGGFAYRKMPLGLIGFVGLSLIVLGSDWLNLEPTWMLGVVGVIALVGLGINLGINLQRRRAPG